MEFKKLWFAVMTIIFRMQIYGDNLPILPPFNSLNNFNIPTSSPNNKLHYFFNGKSAKNVLSKYALDNGLNIKFSTTVADSKQLNKSVNGQFDVAGDDELLNALGQLYNFNWFIYANNLYITAKEYVTAKADVDANSMAATRDALSAQNLLLNKFGYTEIPNKDQIIISGPADYVNIVIKQIQNLSLTPATQQYAVYRLKYASAADITLSFNNQQILIPGVATILRNLLSSTNGGNHKTIDNTALLSSALTGNSNESHVSSSSSEEINQNIQSDARLNTIVIHSTKDNLEIYKNLIAALDVPAPLIQVDVTIININQDDLNQNGTNWGILTKNGTAIAGGAGTPVPIQAGQMVGGILNPGQILIDSAQNFMVGLQFLEQHQMAQTVSSPALVTTDNLPGIMSLNELIYATNTNNNTGANSNSNNNVNYSNTQAQIINSLAITPHVIDIDSGQRMIKLSIALQDGGVQNQNNTQGPSIIQGTITSQVVIKEGQSILMAGYSRNSEEKITSQIPFFGSIPLIGWLFKNTTIENKKITHLYLVTPKVIWLGKMFNIKNYIIINGQKIKVPPVLDQSIFNDKDLIIK